MNAPAPCLNLAHPAAAADRVRALAARVSPATHLTPNTPLAARTTLRTGGRADLLIEPANAEDLGQVLRFCHENRLPWRVLGRGSNLLIRDGGLREWVILLSQPAFQRIEVRDERLHCGAGVRLKALAAAAVQHGLAGLEFLAGIPGSVGGALRMNAGAHAAWTFQVVEQVRGFDPAGEPGEWTPDQLPVGYRGCDFFRDHLAVAAVFRGRPDEPEAIRGRLEAFHQHRRRSQPREPSAGCIFKNPDSVPAGKLIEDLGLKGASVGGAQISTRHGNFIINTGGAAAADVLQLIAQVQRRAREQAGVKLETEIEILGEDAPVFP